MSSETILDFEFVPHLSAARKKCPTWSLAAEVFFLDPLEIIS